MTLLQYIRQNFDLSFQDTDIPFPIYKSSLKANTILCDFGEVESKMYFLNQGLIQVSFLDKNLNEGITDFFLPNHFFCSFTSYITGLPSDVEVIALTDIDIEYFEKQDLLKSYETSLLINKIGRKATEALYLNKIKRVKDFLTKTAEERYIELINSCPLLLKHLTIDKIAKYLGIRPESLSRIRRKKVNRI
jgi:CRP-like cAMP-binding protein